LFNLYPFHTDTSFQSMYKICDSTTSTYLCIFICNSPWRQSLFWD